jgi:hypothetical protein
LPSLISPKIIVPDTSHWAKWIDAALGADGERRRVAQQFEDRLLASGRVPLLSWHHIEELLGIADESSARRRLAFLQQRPLIAYVRLPVEAHLAGSIIDVVAAEVSAALSGASNLEAVRAEAKRLMLRWGPARDAFSDEAWVWDLVRAESAARREQAKFVVSTKGMDLFDDRRTVGEIARGRIRTDAEMAERIASMRQEVDRHLHERGDREITNHAEMTDRFMGPIESWSPAGLSVRDLIVLALTSQGVDPDEIKDDHLLADLNRLAMYRAKLQVIAEKLQQPFDRLKTIPMEILPSLQVENALVKWGQDRRPSGGDLVDGHLATLAPYVDELFVDKRTAEDFRRVASNGGSLIAPLLCTIRKASNFTMLAEADTVEPK